MPLLFNMLSRLVIAFLPRSKHLNFMAAVTIYSDFWAPQKWSLTLFSPFLHLFPMKGWGQMPWSSLSECWALSQLFTHLSLSLRLFSSCSLSAIRVVSSAYLRLLIYLPAILIPASASCSPAFHMMICRWHHPYAGKWRDSLGLQGDLTSPSWRQSVLSIHWKDWCWSWSTNTLVT